MFELRKSFTFEASHQLMHHDGKCSNLHGHSYTIAVVLRSTTLAEEGAKRNMVEDFSDISKVVKKLLITHLDHKHLNETLGTDSPTAEYIAYWCFHQLLPELPLLSSVEICETSSASVIYRPDLPMEHPLRQPNGYTTGSHAFGLANGKHDAEIYPANCRHCTTCPNCRSCEYRLENATRDMTFPEQKGSARRIVAANGYGKAQADGVMNLKQGATDPTSEDANWT